MDTPYPIPREHIGGGGGPRAGANVSRRGATQAGVSGEHRGWDIKIKEAGPTLVWGSMHCTDLKYSSSSRSVNAHWA